MTEWRWTQRPSCAAGSPTGSRKRTRFFQRVRISIARTLLNWLIKVCKRIDFVFVKLSEAERERERDRERERERERER